jgi:hypothetical protein
MKQLTVLEVAARLGVSRSRVQSLLSLKELEGTREMRRVMGIDRVVWFISEDAFDAYQRSVESKREARRPAIFVPTPIEFYPVARAVELAWLAGIVDGEGYIGLTQKLMRSKGTSTKTWVGYTPNLVVAINSEFVCRRAALISGVGKVFLKEIKNGKEHWCWRCRYSDCVIALQLLLPFLMEKCYQAQLVLRGAYINATYQAERDWQARLPERSAELKALATELISLHGQSGGRHARARSAELNSFS